MSIFPFQIQEKLDAEGSKPKVKKSKNNTGDNVSHILSQLANADEPSADKQQKEREELELQKRSSFKEEIRLNKLASLIKFLRSHS